MAWPRRHALWAVLSVLACLVLLELGSRAFIWLSLHDQATAGDDHLRYSNGEQSYDSVLGWTVQINGPAATPQGTPSAEPTHTADRPFRLFVVGDSVAYGPSVKPDETFATLVGRELDRRFPGRAHEVFNAAVPGYGLTQIAERLKRDVLPNQPDLVLVCADPFDDDPLTYEGISERRQNPPIVQAAQRLLHHSRLYYLLSLGVVHARHRLLGLSYRDRGTAMEIIEAMLVQQRTPHLYLSVPQLDQDRDSAALTQEQRSWYASSGLTWVDAFPGLEQELRTRSTDELFFDKVHLTVLGHRIVAQQITDYLGGAGAELVSPR